MEKLYVSDEVVELVGLEVAKEFNYDDFKPVAVWGEYVTVDYKLLLTRDDMDDLYLSVGEDDSSFTEVERL